MPLLHIGRCELPELIRAIHGYGGDETPRRRAVTRAALLFTLLTWTRTNEKRHASWDEFEDVEGAAPLRRVPAERMKMARGHVVPLAPAVVALLNDVRLYSTGRYVFAGEKPDRPISQNTMIYACYRMGYRARQTVRGFWELASTWADEAECYQGNGIEMALAHVERDEVRGAYNATFYLTPGGRKARGLSRVYPQPSGGDARGARELWPI